MMDTPPLPPEVWETLSPEAQAAVLALVGRLEQRITELAQRVQVDAGPIDLFAQPGFLECADGARGPLVVAAIANVRLQCVHLVDVVNRDDGHIVIRTPIRGKGPLRPAGPAWSCDAGATPALGIRLPSGDQQSCCFR